MKKYIQMRALLLLSAIISLTACNKKNVGPQGGEEGTVPGKFEHGIFIMNEGNFGTNNGSVSYYDPATGKVDNKLYEAANLNQRLGDVVQSMTVNGDMAYIVVNNSKKIEVVGLSDFRHVATIDQLKSPRFMLIIDEHKAYVTNFILENSSNVISVVDIDQNKVIKSITVNGWTESLTAAAGKVFVANRHQDKILVIDPASDLVVNEIEVNEDPQSMVTDSEGMLWVLCTGGDDTKTPALIRIDPINMQIVNKLENFKTDSYPTELRINGKGNTLFFLNEDLYKLSVKTSSLPDKPLIDLADFQYTYGLGVDPENSEIYLTDAKDFQQEGEVVRFDSTGVLISRFKVGEGPGNLLFYY